MVYTPPRTHNSTQLNTQLNQRRRARGSQPVERRPRAQADRAIVARERVAPIVSLYVNDYNAVARRCYEAVGFRAAGEFATVLL